MFTLPPPTALPSAGLSELGEGPVWDHRHQRFFWVDIQTGTLHALDPATGQRSSWSTEDSCGFAVPTPDPQVWITARGSELVRLDLESGRIGSLHRLDDNAIFRCNDGKCDPQGRLWVGTMPREGSAFTGTLYRVRANTPPAPQRTGVGCSNGLAWSPDGTAFYYIDSPKRCIDRYDWDPVNGAIRNPVSFATFAPAQGLPDGMCIDRDGHLWVAFWGGSCVRRIDGQTGAILASIEFPVSLVTSCAFGGPDLDTLFVTTARTGLDRNQQTAQPLAGAVFTCAPGCGGLPVDFFTPDKPQGAQRNRSV